MVESGRIGNVVKKRLNKWSRGLEAPPVKITIYLTNSCNLRCKFCISYIDGPCSGELSKDEWLGVVKEGVEMGVKEWEFSGGGEPLVKKDTFVGIIDRIKSVSGNECTLITNGTLIDEELSRSLVKNEFDRIYFSLESHSSEINDELRGVKGSLARVIKSFSLLNNIKEELDADKPRLGITTVLTSKNFEHVPELIHFADYFDCDKIKLHPLIWYNELEENMLELEINDEDRLNEIIIKSKKLSESKEIELQIDSLDIYDTKSVDNEKNPSNLSNVDDFLKSPCFEPWRSIMIDSIGNVGPCVCWGSGEEGVNVKKKGLKNIWHGDFLKDVRRKILNHDLFDNCYSCGFKNRVNDMRKSILESE